MPTPRPAPIITGRSESVIYVVRGKARMRWGERLEFVPKPAPATSSTCRPMCRTRRSTPAARRPLECVLVRSDGEAVVVNLDIEPVEAPENVPWIDPIHRGQ